MKHCGDLRQRPIVDQAFARTAKSVFRMIRLPDQDDRALRDAKSFGVQGRNHYAHAANPPYWRAIDGAIDALWVRPAVGERLATVNARLLPDGLRLHLFDAWRPRAVQAHFHDVWMPAQLRARDPSLTGDALTQAVQRYWSAPSEGAASPAPHETGAAVDLTIVQADGAPLFMGTVFDDATALSAIDAFEGDEPTEWSMSFEEARANRRLLFWLMTEAGFANHPDEWWHFSFGDQFWAAQKGQSEALFGLAAPP